MKVNTKFTYYSIYLCFSNLEKEGSCLNDLCLFWIGCDYLPYRQEMLVKFDINENNKMPKAERCFMTLMLPVAHDTYDSFRSVMNTAIAYESRGFAFA